MTNNNGETRIQKILDQTVSQREFDRHISEVQSDIADLKQAISEQQNKNTEHMAESKVQTVLLQRLTKQTDELNTKVSKILEETIPRIREESKGTAIKTKLLWGGAASAIALVVSLLIKFIF